MAGEPAQVGEVVFDLLMGQILRQEVATSVGVPSAKTTLDQAQLLGSRMEGMGYQVGYRLVERTAQHRFLSGVQLDVIKFLCKDLWTQLFKKQVDNLKTDHRGTFVLKDNNFRWVVRYAAGNSTASKELAAKILHFPCGLLRGALANLGLTASVKANGEGDRGQSSLPAVAFTIKIL